MRLFVALNPPGDVREALFAATAPLRDALGDAVRWTEAAKVHLTVRFLGERGEDVPARLLAALAPAAARHAPVRATVTAPGAFPSLRRPRVLWLGLAETPALRALYEDVERACAAVGLGRERRPWHPHLTLGRVRDGARVDGAALERAAGAVRAGRTFIVRSVDVMHSELDSAGARYTCLGACALEGV